MEHFSQKLVDALTELRKHGFSGKVLANLLALLMVCAAPLFIYAMFYAVLYLVALLAQAGSSLVN